MVDRIGSSRQDTRLHRIFESAGRLQDAPEIYRPERLAVGERTVIWMAPPLCLQ